jgi:hypothetical protein
MPVVAYYLGRPARIWIAAMSGSAPGNTGEPGRHRTRSALRSASAARRGTREETSAPAATAVIVSASPRTPLNNVAG